MPAIRIPRTQGNWTGRLQGDYYGDIRRTFNIDLEKNTGKIELSAQQNVVFSSDSTSPGDSNFRRVEAFARVNFASDSGVRYYALTGDCELADNSRMQIYRSGDSNGDTGWAPDTVGAVFSVTRSYQDMVNFPNPTDTNQDRLFITMNDSFIVGHTGINDTLGWRVDTAIIPPGFAFSDSGQYFHPLDVFEGNLLVGSKNKLSTLDNVDSGIINNRMTIPAQFWMHHLFHTSGSEWILSANEALEGMISEWDGYSLLPVRNHIVSSVPISGVDYYGTPIVLLADGRILAGNGGSFISLRDAFGRELLLPVAKEKGNSLLSSTNWPIDPTTFAVARRGMIVDGEVIKFNLSRSFKETFGEFEQNSGIWVLNPKLGTLYNSSSLADTDGLGHGFMKRSGAMLKDPMGGIKLASGIAYRSFDTTAIATISTFREIDDSSLQRGFIESQFMNLPVPEGAWETLWVKHRKFSDTNCRIIAKARIEEGPYFVDTDIDQPNIAQVDFDDDTAFIVLLSAAGDALDTGDEIEVLAGPNAGKLAHITSISGTHGDTQVVTIDEVFDSSPNLSAATFKRWKKLTLSNGDSSISFGDSLVIHSFVIPSSIKNSPKLSIKLELRGRARDITIEEMALQYEVAKQTKK